ncbi:MAG TPA: hypothetical protein VF444_02550 [Pseudonocardiaceae bacterium]
MSVARGVPGGAAHFGVGKQQPTNGVVSAFMLISALNPARPGRAADAGAREPGDPGHGDHPDLDDHGGPV